MRGKSRRSSKRSELVRRYHGVVRSWWVVALASLASCGFEKSLLEPDARPNIDDEGREIRAWNFDTAAEFGAAGMQAIDMTVDPLGALTPEGYVYGVLIARGVQGTKLWSGADADWSKIATVTPAGYGLWAGNDLDAAVRDLSFVGITNTAMTSVWFEGEMWINPGEPYKLTGNDTAFLYAALDGVQFTKVLHNSTAAIQVTQAGWYPVRIGWADGDNNGDIELEVNPGGGFIPLEHTRFRATTSHLRGMARNVYYREIHGGGIDGNPPVMSVQETPIHTLTSFNPPLPGSVTISTMPFDWSARWSGQFYATVAGMYTFRVASDDGNRIQLGSQVGTSNFTRNAKGTVATEVTSELVVGWNDLVVDYNHVDSTPSFAVTITAAPPADAALVGLEIPKDRLRPIEPRADRLITRSNVPNTPVTIVDNQAGNFAELGMQIDAHPGELVSSIEVTARVNTSSPTQLAFRLIAPNSQQQSRTMIVVQDGNGGNSHIAQGVYDVMANMPASGLWKFGISDVSGSGGSGNSSYEELHLTIHTTGGREQIAPASTWRSPVIENATDVVLVDFVNFSQRVPAGAAVMMQLRTCAMADCSDGVWSEPLASGAAPVLPRNRNIQLQITMSSNGTTEPELDKINIQYRTAPPK